MNEKLASMLRHGATFVPGLGAALLAKGWLDADAAKTFDAEQAQFLIYLAGVVAALLSRAILWLLAKFAPQFLPFFANLGKTGTSSLFAFITTAVGFAMAGILLSSCSPQSVAAWGSAFDAKAVLTHTDEKGNSASVVIRPKKITELKSARGKVPSSAPLKFQVPKEDERVEALGFRIWNPLRDPLPRRQALTPAEYAEVFRL